MLRRSLALPAALAALLSGAPAAASAATPAPHRPGEVVVRWAAGASDGARAAARDAAGVRPQEALAPGAQLVRVTSGRSVAAAAEALRSRPGVETATPNYLAHASAYVPRDPGASATPGGWQLLQWNFLPDAGVNAPVAWQHLIDAGAPGGRGVTVAVLDTGVAYEDRGAYRRSPDFAGTRFVRGRDFVDGDDHPDDANGHGTHVAGTIAETAGNGVGVTGLAYGARLMPVRVLDRAGWGDVVAIAKGIRWAARHGADVINLSLEFDASVTRASIPEIIAALRYAHRRGALVVAAAGNEGAATIALPARAGDVLAVGATTQHGCRAVYSNRGARLDLVAPGGGEDAVDGVAGCGGAAGGDIYQLTYDQPPVWSDSGRRLLGGSLRSFGLPAGYDGTSVAAPHAAATAALVIASRVLGRDPEPDAVARRLAATARDLGPRGRDRRFGWGLIDAARATDPAVR
jgi:serine protease